MTKKIKLVFAFTVLCLVSTSVAKDIFEFEIVSESSSAIANLSLQSDLPGSLIGNFDEVNNPEGTLTLPGIFGGSGNQSVELDMTGILTGNVDSQPLGGFQLDLDLEGLSASISNFELDVLGSQPGSLALMLDLNFETFRTFQPDSLFVGLPIALPLGEGELTELSFQQSGAANPAQLIPLAKDHYSFSLIVPATISIESEILGQPISPPPFDLVVLLNGEINVDGDQVIVTQSFEQMFGDQISDIQNGDFSDLPLPIPTILPPGGTANLLISGAVDSFAFSIDLNAMLTAQGNTSTVVPGDLNGDGMVSLLDVSLFVTAIIDGTFVPAADINGDGTVNLEDVAPFIDLLVD